MLFNVALLTGLFLTSEVLAVPSGQGASLARRRNAHRYTRPYVYASDTTEYTSNWAGAVWTESAGTFTSVTGTFTAPTPSGSTGASAAAWVGIDGSSCPSTILQTGVAFTVSPSGGATYVAWYEWFPAASHDFSGITISAGDDIKLTVTATSKTTGTAMVENLTNGQTVSANLTSSTPLCEQDAEWIVEDYMEGFRLVPFANFSTVAFTNAEATGTGIYTPSGANITDIKQNGKTLTSVSTSGSSVTIDYV